tara:strand:+ start:1098 stop:1457 length:360 start_codon:yes stop_codon:yes gene_type:complete
MDTVQPIINTGFRQFTRNEAVAVMDAKTAKISENFERELRVIQEKIHTTVRELVRDQLELLSKGVGQNTADIRRILDRRRDENASNDGLEAIVRKNTENIKIIDSNIKTIDKNVQQLIN